MCAHAEAHESAAARAKAENGAESAARMARIFHTLSDAGRLRIVLALMQGESCVYHLTEICGGSQSGVSHQLRVLRDNGIVRAKRIGKTVEYALADGHVREIVSLCQTHIDCLAKENLQ